MSNTDSGKMVEMLVGYQLEMPPLAIIYMGQELRRVWP